MMGKDKSGDGMVGNNGGLFGGANNGMFGGSNPF